MHNDPVQNRPGEEELFPWSLITAAPRDEGESDSPPGDHTARTLPLPYRYHTRPFPGYSAG